MKNAGKKVFYITTNGSWSGSEELWVRSAKGLLSQGYSIGFASKYFHSELAALSGKHYIFSERFRRKEILKRILEKLLKIQFKTFDVISEILSKEKPALVILSQGNNIDNDGVMGCCYNLKIPYITITHLVTEYFYLSINEHNLLALQQGYLNAAKNFFVSHHNLRLNNLMLAIELSNTEVVFNPCKIAADEIPGFADVGNGFKVGLVGRIECFHKGYDLLLKVAAKEKWKQRAIHFNIYGEGPHTSLLASNITRLELLNLSLQGYNKNVHKVWAENHILLMPSRMEGLPLTLIEAMFCNRPAVVTDVGGATELIKEGYNGFIAETASVESIDNALERAWLMRESWEELGKNAGQTIRNNYPADAAASFNKNVLPYIN